MLTDSARRDTLSSMPERGDTPDTPCSHKGCTATYRPHRWGQTKAHSDGWFLQRNGDAWCPEHHPEWVAAWRASRG